MSTFLFGIFSLATLASTSSSVVSEPRLLHAYRTATPILVDGKGDDEAWQHAQRDTRFTERVPNLGSTPPVDTSVQVAYDDVSLYVLIQGTINGDEAIIRSLRRDSFQIFSDDTVSIKIDPYFDRRSSYLFGANLAGAQVDTMALEDGRVHISEWDAVWEVEGSQNNGRFTLEYRIPFYALGIKNGESLKMGLDVSRDDPARGATYDWKLIVPPRSPSSASAFGTLVGLENIDARPVLEITPYALARTDFSNQFEIDPRAVPNLATGLDIRLQTGPGAFAEASFLTDFSQVDIDEVQVASDRFPLFFPERRPFFLNGLDVFNFGYVGEAQLFFSRRIGLNGRVAPIAAGIKAYGRSGTVSYGALNVQTMKVLRDPNEEDSRELPRENFTVGRVRIQALPQVAVGILAAGRKRISEEPGDAAEVGFDMELKTADSRLRSYNFVAASWRELERSELEDIGEIPDPDRALTQSRGGTSMSSSIEYRGLYIRPSANWLWSDRHFQAPLGFYSRPGTASQSAELMFVPRPNFLGIRDIDIGPQATLVTTPGYEEILTASVSGTLAFHWKNNWDAGYWVGYTNDKVSEAFEIFGGLPVLADRYDNVTHEIWMASPSRYIFSSSVNYGVGRRFGGPSQRIYGDINLRLGRHFTLTSSYTHFIGHLVEKSDKYNFGFANGQTVVAITRDFIWDTLFRVNTMPNGERFGLQSRLRWRYRPGSDIYLVYSNNIPLTDEVAEDTPAQHALTLKFNVYLAPRLPG